MVSDGCGLTPHPCLSLCRHPWSMIMQNCVRDIMWEWLWQSSLIQFSFFYKLEENKDIHLFIIYSNINLFTISHQRYCLRDAWQTRTGCKKQVVCSYWGSVNYWVPQRRNRPDRPVCSPFVGCDVNDPLSCFDSNVLFSLESSYEVRIIWNYFEDATKNWKRNFNSQ